ncbi:M48 family metalloprotease [Kitasatospora acidiphila]|uniref:M48 family metalloprotease n=1 Tax=Kitasatospora acidiphila TaxID=2567942 RepID=UPI003C7475DD
MAQSLTGPSSTTLRFGSLILLAVAATVAWWSSLIDIWRPVNGLPEAQCEVHSGYYTAMGPATWLSPSDQVKYQHYQHCAANTTLPDMLWTAAALGVLALVTLLLFALHPWWHQRRLRLVPIDESAPETAALRAELRQLVELAGLSREPLFLLDLANHHPAGRAFGGLGRRRVRLSAGLAVQLRHAPEKFRAKVAHELAHIRTGDVTVTYLTFAVWRAFVLVTVLPVLISLVDPYLETAHPLGNPLDSSWHFAFSQFLLGWFLIVLIALGYVLRASVLRAREGYADALAARWTGLATVRATLAASAEGDRTRWWHTHPRLLDRVRLLDRPERLLRPGFWEMFTAGFVVQVAGDYAYQAKSNWNMDFGSFAFRASLEAATALPALVVVVAGWRGAAFVRSGAGGRGVYTRGGLGLGLGLATAFDLGILRLYLVLRHTPDQEGAFTAAGLEQDLVLSVLMLAAVLILCHWSGHCWQLVATASRRHRVLAATAMLLAGWACLHWWTGYNYEWPLVGHYLSANAAVWRHFVSQAHGGGLDLVVVKAVLAPHFLMGLFGWVTVFAAPLLWLLPLFLGAARREAVRSAARAGAVAAALWLAVDLGLRLLAHLTASPAVRGTDGYAVVFLCWEIAALLAVQAGSALWLGARGTRMMPSLFGTALTSLLCCLLLWIAHRTDTCLPALGLTAGRCPGSGDVFVAFEALHVVGILSFALTLAGVLLGRTLRRRAAAQLPAVTVRTGAPMRLALLAVAGMFTAVAVWPMLHLWPDARHPRVSLIGVPDFVPPVYSNPELVGKASFEAWLTGGGQGQSAGAFSAYDRYIEQLRPRFEQPDPDWYAIAHNPQVRSACQAFNTILGTTRAFPTPPWTTAATHWSAYLHQLTTAADACTTAGTAPDAQTAQVDLAASVVPTHQQVNALLADAAAAMSTVS